MLIYNTTYHVENEAHDNFLIWIKECFIPEISRDEVLKAPRLCRILSHHDDGHSYSLQWEVENSTILHRWHTEKGIKYNEEITKIFKDKVVSFPTLMEIIE
jgi:hypothetical protein